MLSLDLYLKLRKVVCSRIAECERERSRLAEQPKRGGKRSYWEKELTDCDSIMRWLDTQTPEVTRPKELKPSELIAEILTAHLGVTL